MPKSEKKKSKLFEYCVQYNWKLIFPEVAKNKVDQSCHRNAMKKLFRLIWKHFHILNYAAYAVPQLDRKIRRNLKTDGP